MPTERRAASLPVLFSVIVVDLIGFGIVLPVLPFYMDSFGGGGTLVGIALGGYSAMQFLFSPVWGRLSDRIGRRPIMLLTIAGTSVSLLGLGLADSLLWIVVARLAAGAFAANITVATAYIADITAEEERTRWMGMVGASFAAGFTLGPAIGGLLAIYGYAAPMYFAAGLAALNLVYALAVLREPTVHTEHPASSGASRIEVLRSPFIRRLTLLNLLFTLGVTQLETLFQLLMKDRFAYDATEAAYILVAMGVFMGAVQGGGIRPLAARFGEGRLLRAGFAIMAVSFLGIPFAGTVALLLVPLLGLGFGRAISQPPMLSMASIAAAAGSRGSVMGTFQSSAHLARIFGPIVAGLLYDHWPQSPFFLASAFILAAVAVALPMPARAADVASQA